MNDALGNPQSVLVLGGGSDIGLATVRAMLDRRLRSVVLAGRHPEALERHAIELRSLGAESVEVEAFDALDPTSHDGFVDRVFDRHPHLDLVLVAFGVLGDQGEAERPGGEAARITATNYTGAVTACLAASRRLRTQGHGDIVVLSSVAGERARAANFVYGSSKAGLDAFAQGLGDSLQGTGVRVMVVRPGFVRSKMTAGMDAAPLSSTPEAVAEAIVAGLGRGSEVVHVPRTLRWVMSALRHLPRAAFRRLPIQ
ncbi:MAG: decaprenylphospho-beta-D-erythro-pentofuranosid-2-ulose 2-reductase [Acidimicrobiia bacterium]|nr:decaprenylphospho-beta-D-erythro-pentofuranosid-2-ulose 2-reductase [Acidimicrobiia bacterium]